MNKTLFSAALVATFLSSAAQAQETKEPRRVRVGLGAQVTPRYPGAEDMTISPYGGLSITRGDKPFDYSANDDSAGFALIDSGGFNAGPAVSFEGKRRRRDVGANVDEVGFSLEAGGFVQYWLSPAFRVRAEGRKGITGHKALVGSVGADFVARDGDRYVFSIGPRLGLSDQKYQQAYFGVNAREAAATGLARYRPGGGIHAYGVASNLNVAITERVGVMAYAKYDRLSEDAGRSPLVRRYGKRDQLGGGLGLTYTFGGRR